MLRGHLPAAVAAGLKPVGRLPRTQRLRLAVGLALRNQQALAALLQQIYDPGSPQYRHFLTPAQFAARFGPTQQDYEAVAAFASAHGLAVSARYGNRLVLDVSGAVSDIENTLHVTMRTYHHPTEARDFFAPDQEPSLDLAIPLSHIGGLDNYGLPKPCLKVRAPVPGAQAKPNTGSGPSGEYMGSDFRAAYAPGVSLTGTGQVIGLLEFDGFAASDITYYENAAGLPNVTLSTVLLDGFNGTPTSLDPQIEVSLDIEMGISMAPGMSQIIIYEAGESGNFDDILNRMVSDNLAKQLSSSWSISGEGDDSTADNDFAEMAAQGQSFYQASGDSDAYTRSIPFPCDNPYITIVGGTTLADAGTGGAWSSETAWNWGYDSSAGEYVGTSGGISPTYSIPSWQKGISMTANKGSTTKRDIPDVALTANNVYVRAASADYDIGGTSCAAPLWAAFTALVNQQALARGTSTVGFVNSAVYTIGAGSAYGTDFHDITTGNNYSRSSPSKFAAVTGYDLCTGWGTPAGAALINALAPAPASLQVAPESSFDSAGPAGGPFSPASATYGLDNPGTTSLSWTGSATQPWLTLSATAGTLSASGSASVTASINANADALTSGSYSDTLSFTYGSTVQTIPVGLVVIGPPVITSTLTSTATAAFGFTYQIAATNSPASYAAMNLPGGLTINQTTGAISGTASASGTSAVTISAINVAGAGRAVLALTIDNSFQAWQDQAFNSAQLANSAISADTASPAGDGITNLLKYALNLNPWTSGATGMPVASLVTTGSGTYLQFTYTQAPADTDLTYTVQLSSDLQNWVSGTGYVVPVSIVNNGGGATETVTVQSTIPESGTAPQFMRLQVTGP